MNDKKTRNYPAKISLFIRLIAGAYLLYLSYGLTDTAFGGQGSAKILALIFTVVFAVVGVFLLVLTAKHLMNGEFQGGSADTSSEENEEEEEKK